MEHPSRGGFSGAFHGPPPDGWARGRRRAVGRRGGPRVTGPSRGASRRVDTEIVRFTYGSCTFVVWKLFHTAIHTRATLARASGSCRVATTLSLPPCRCVTADGAASRPTARDIREPGLQLPLAARQARAQASLRGPHAQPARRPPPVHRVRGVLALRGAVRRLGAPLQGQGQLPARELRRARARGDICDPAQAQGLHHLIHRL